MSVPRRRLAAITLLVPDYDEGIAHYCDDLGARLVEDTDLGGAKRWVRVSFGGGSDLLLARAAKPEQQQAIGHQGGGRVFLFLHTEDIRADRERLLAAGVRFREDLREEPYGIVAVFEDRYGNPWDLIQPSAGITRGE